MIGLSTAWIPENGWPIDRVLDAFSVFDLESVEFNYRVHPFDLEATQRELQKRGLAVTSLHNICSNNRTPVGNGNHYGDTIASLDEEARRAGATHLMATAAAARSLGARAVVVHGGVVEALKAYPHYRQAMRQAAEENDADIVRRLLPALLEDRRAMAPQHVVQLIRSLEEVCPLFPDIQFGLETRYDFYCLPDYDELEVVLEELDCDNIGYWHDCGHGQVQENLGICRHEDWLERYQDRLLGLHLHGMFNAILDHQAPAEDNMDFAMIRRYLRPDSLLTLEVNGENSAESVKSGMAYLEDVLGD